MKMETRWQDRKPQSSNVAAVVIEHHSRDFRGQDAFLPSWLIADEAENHDDDEEKAMRALAPWARGFSRCGGGWRAFEWKADLNKWEAIL